MSDDAVKKIVITGGAAIMKRGRKMAGKTRKIGGERDVPSSVATVTDKATLVEVASNVSSAKLGGAIPAVQAGRALGGLPTR